MFIDLKSKMKFEKILNRYIICDITPIENNNIVDLNEIKKESVYTNMLSICYQSRKSIILDYINKIEPFFQTIQMQDLIRKNDVNDFKKINYEVFHKIFIRNQKKINVKDFLLSSYDDTYKIFNRNFEKKVNNILNKNGIILFNFKNYLTKTKLISNKNNFVYKGELILEELNKNTELINNKEFISNYSVINNLSNKNTVIYIDSIDHKIKVNLCDKKYRFCKNKVSKQIEINLISPYQIVDISDTKRIIFRRIFCKTKFCNENRYELLETMLPILSALKINYCDFLKIRVLAFYNHDIKAVDLARDFNLAQMIFSNIKFDLKDLLSFTEDCIVEMYGDKEIVELYLILINIKEINRIRNKSNNNIINNTFDNLKIVELVNESPCFYKYYNSLKTRIITYFNTLFDKYDGFDLIYNISNAVQNYKSRRVIISKIYLSDRLKNTFINKKYVISAGILLEKAQLPLIPAIYSIYYNEVQNLIKKLSFFFNSMLKKNDLSRFFNILTKLNFKVNSNNQAFHSTFLRTQLIPSLEIIYISRLNKVKTVKEMSKLFLLLNEFQQYFGQSERLKIYFEKNLLINELKKLINK